MGEGDCADGPPPGDTGTAADASPPPSATEKVKGYPADETAALVGDEEQGPTDASQVMKGGHAVVVEQPAEDRLRTSSPSTGAPMNRGATSGRRSVATDEEALLVTDPDARLEAVPEAAAASMSGLDEVSSTTDHSVSSSSDHPPATYHVDPLASSHPANDSIVSHDLPSAPTPTDTSIPPRGSLSSRGASAPPSAGPAYATAGNVQAASATVSAVTNDSVTSAKTGVPPVRIGGVSPVEAAGAIIHRPTSPAGERAISQMDGVMLVLANITDEWRRDAKPDDWKAICTGCGMVGQSNTEVDDMVWFVVGKNGQQTAEVRRRTEQDTWLSNDPDVDWEKTLYLNIVVNWQFELTVAVVDNETQYPVEWITRRVYASPEQAVLSKRGNQGARNLNAVAKDITYEKQYPNVFFNIEDWSDAFGDMRLAKGQLWAMEVSALSSDGKRVHIVKGKLAYENVAKKFQLTAGAAKVDHSVTIPINTPVQERCGEITVNVAPEEAADENSANIAGEKHAHNKIMQLASRMRKRVDGTFVKGKVAATANPTLQCYLNFVCSDQAHLIDSIKRLKTSSDAQWIKIPSETVQRSVCEPPTNFSGERSFALQRSFAVDVSPARTRGATVLRKTGEVRAECFLPQMTCIAAPVDAEAYSLWHGSFETDSPLQLVDVLMEQIHFKGWVAKRGGKRIIATQAYKQRLCVITSKGLLHYFQDSEPRSVVRGTCYLRGVRLARRSRSALISATPYVLELHPCTPRRPGDTKDDRVFHFAFATTAELEDFMAEVAAFALVPP